MSKAYEFLKECGAFFVLTLNGEYPAGRPFGADVGGMSDFPEKIWRSWDGAFSFIQNEGGKCGTEIGGRGYYYGRKKLEKAGRNGKKRQKIRGFLVATEKMKNIEKKC